MNSGQNSKSGAAASRAKLRILALVLLASGAAWLGARAQEAKPQDQNSQETKPQDTQDAKPEAEPKPANNGIVTSEGVMYRFAYLGNVAQVPIELVSGRVAMPVRINTGKPGFFLVATGATRTEIDPKPWLPQDAAANTPIDFEKTLLTVPGLDMQVSQILPASLVPVSNQVGQPIRGILGADVLRQFVIEIDYNRSAIHFYDPKSFQYSGKGVTLPLIMRGGIPSVRVKVAMEGHGSFEDDFAITTESDAGVSISKLYVGAHHLHTGKLKGLHTEPNGEKTLFARVKTVSIGPFHFEEPIAAFPSGSAAENPGGGSVGNALLARFRVFLDQPHHQLILETGSNYRGDFQWDMSGVDLTAKGTNLKTFEVQAVAPHTPASEAGLQKGDVIAGIDGQPAADLDLSGVRDMFRQTAHEYHLTVVRGDHTVEMKLKTKKLV